MKIRWSPLAIERVSDIAGYIAQEDGIAAQKWVELIFDRVKQVKDFSRSGRCVPELNRKDVRELIYGNYRIIYRLEVKAISILTVRHSKQILPVAEIDC